MRYYFAILYDMLPIYIAIASVIGATRLIPVVLVLSAWGIGTISSWIFTSPREEPKTLSRDDVQLILREELVRLTQMMRIESSGRIELTEEDFEYVTLKPTS